MAGQKARRTPTTADRIREQVNRTNDLYALSRIGRSPIQVSTPLSASSVGGGISTPASGNFLKTSGDTMIGSIAFLPVTAAVSSERIDISQNAGKNSSYAVVGTGTMRYIDGAIFNGQLVMIQGAEGGTLTIKQAVLRSATSIVGDGSTNTITVTTTSAHTLTTGNKVNIQQTDNFNINDVSITVTGASTFTYDLGSVGSATPETGSVQYGNIVTSDGSDITLDGTVAADAVPMATFIFDQVIEGYGGWREVSRSGGGSGSGVTFPIAPTVTDNSDTWTGNQTLDLDTGDGHIYKWTMDQDLTFESAVSNKPASGTQRTFELEFVHDGVGGTFTVTLPSNFQTETGATLATVDVKLDQTVIITARINDGTNFLVIQKNVAGATAAGGGSQTPWLSDIDADGFDLADLSNLEFRTTAGAPASTIPNIHHLATGTVLNTPDTLKFFFAVNGTTEYSMDQTTFDINGNTIALDADADTTISSVVDDNLQIATGGVARATFNNTNLLMAQDIDMNGNDIIVDADGDTVIGDGGIDDQFQIATGGSARATFSNSNLLMAVPIDMGGADINNGGVVFLTEQAAAEADVAGKGQIWVKTATPNELYFTDDAGTDHQLGLTGSFLTDIVDDTTPQLGGTLDANGNDIDLNATGTIILDADADSVISAAVDDNIQIATGGVARATFGNSSFSLSTDLLMVSADVDLAANSLILDADNDTTISAAVDDNLQFSVGGSAVATMTTSGLLMAGTITFDDGTHDIGTSSIGANNIYSDNTLFCSNLKVWTGDSDINVFNDFDMQAGDTVDFADTATTAGAGVRSLPSNPDGFIVIKVNGSSKRVPYYVP